MPSRQLVAIMFTDIQGYTALMQADEEQAMHIRAKHRKVFQTMHRKHDGKIIQYYGDGTLSIFKSAIEAVNCSIEMQRAFRTNPEVPVRIGIHMGDVVLQDEEIIGNSVNVASRIESLSVPGGILISKKVGDEIANHPSIRTLSMGLFHFKNVIDQMEVFAVANEGIVIPDPDKLTGKTRISYTWRKRAWWLFVVIFLSIAIVTAVFVITKNRITGTGGQQNRSIAVLPFDDMSQSGDQAYFSDGMTEDIIAHLSKIEDLTVISRTSTRKYKNTVKTIPEIGKELDVAVILEGSVRKHEDQVRITAQLIDADTDEHLWAEVYDREAERIFDIQSEVAKKIASVLRATLSPKEEAYLDKSPTTEITAYDYYLRGQEVMQSGATRADYEIAAQYYRQAREVDPAFAAAYVGQAYTLAALRRYGAGEEIWRDSVLALNNKALELDPDLAEAHYLQGLYDYGDQKFDQALEGFYRTLKINPNHGRAMIAIGEHYLKDDATFAKGLNLTIDGLLLELPRKEPLFYYTWGKVYQDINEPDNAKKYFKQAIKLKPDYYYAYDALIDDYLDEKEYEKYLETARKMVDIERNVGSLDRLAWGYFYNRKYDEAEKIWREVRDKVEEFDSPFYAVPYQHRLGYLLWQRGEREEAQKLFDDLINTNLYLINNHVQTIYGEYYDLAATYAFLGQDEKALHWFQMAADSGWFVPQFIRRDPLFDSIRNDARFISIFDKTIKRQESEAKAHVGQLKLARARIRKLEQRGILHL